MTPTSSKQKHKLKFVGVYWHLQETFGFKSVSTKILPEKS